MALITQKHEALYHGYFMYFYNNMMRIVTEESTKVASFNSPHLSNCDETFIDVENDDDIQNDCTSNFNKTTIDDDDCMICFESGLKPSIEFNPNKINSGKRPFKESVFKTPSICPSLQSNCEETSSNKEGDKFAISEVATTNKCYYRGINREKTIVKTKEQVEFLKNKYLQKNYPSRSLINYYAKICGLSVLSVDVSFTFLKLILI
jgi:hypothetical protein